MKKKYQVFISSTFIDLKNERQTAVEAVLSSRHIPAGMELFSAGSETQLDTIKKWIRESDIYMLILGGRYGSIEPKSGLSYIELEYDYALELQKPFFAIVLSDEWIEEKVKENGSNYREIEQHQKWKKFYEKVLSRICKIANDNKDIHIAITQAIMDIEENYHLDGWIKGSDQIRSNSAQMVSLGGHTTALFTPSIIAPDTPRFELVDSFPHKNEAIKISEIRDIYLKFSNPIDRRSVMFIATHAFRRNVMFQWNVNGFIQYAEEDTKLIWRANTDFINQEPPHNSDDVEYHRFEILVGHGTPEANLRDVYGNVLPQTIIPVFIKQDKT